MAARPAAGRTRGPEQSSFSIRHLSTAVATEHTRTTTTPAASSILFHCIPHHFGATHTKLQSAVRSLRCTPHHFPHHYEPPHHFVVATPTKVTKALCAERVAPRHFARYAYETPPRRLRRSATAPHRFAVATPTKPRRAERVRVAPRNPASLFGGYAYEFPPCRACRSAAPPLRFAVCYTYDSPPCRVCCSAAWPDLVSSSTPSHPHPSHSHLFLRPCQ